MTERLPGTRPGLGDADHVLSDDDEHHSDPDVRTQHEPRRDEEGPAVLDGPCLLREDASSASLGRYTLRRLRQEGKEQVADRCTCGEALQ